MFKDRLNKVESLGIGLTSKCNLDCPHCYSKNLIKDTITLSEVKQLLKKFSQLKKVNFGTGESILNPDLNKIIDYFYQHQIKIGLTSNGLTINQLSEEILKKIDEVDISLDFPIKKLHNRWRGQGVFENALKAIKRCKDLSIEVSLATALMNINYEYLPKFKNLIDKYNLYFRINLYKPAYSNFEYLLDYNQFWKAIRLIADNFTLISCSEPILSPLIKSANTLKGSPCGNSLRLHPDLSISPCVYLDGHKISLEQFNKYKKVIPKSCQGCLYLSRCHGGCLSRRIFEEKVNLGDSYCPLIRGKKFPKIKFKEDFNKEFIHTNYLCTFILR